MTEQDVGLRKRSLTIARHRTSLALEPIFWRALDNEANDRNLSLAALISEIDQQRASADPPISLASASRVHVVSKLMSKLSEEVS